MPGADEGNEKLLFRYDLGDDVCARIGGLRTPDDLQLSDVARVVQIVQCDSPERAGDSVFRRKGMAVETCSPFQGANGIAGRIGAGREGLRKNLPKDGVLDQQVSVQDDGVRWDGRQM